MKVTQVYEILNTMTKEILGDSVVVNEDLSNVVDIGKAFENLDGAFDNYVRKLHDHIGRMVFVSRVYNGRVPSVVRDAWEYGSILEKVRADLLDTEEDESWKLRDRASYDTNVFYAPKISVKFFNDRVSWKVPISYTRKQIKSSFSSPEQLNGFYTLIETAVQNTINLNLDNLVMATIRSAIGETVYSEFPTGGYSNGTSVKAVNLLYEYNQTVAAGSQITASEALRDSAFLRFATVRIKNYVEYLKDFSTLFNVEGTQKFTPADRQRFVMLSEFKNAIGAYLYDGTSQFRTSDIELPTVDVVTKWQGSGTSYAFDDVSNVDVKTPTGHTVDITGIVGVIFDYDALGVSNLERDVRGGYNFDGDFWSELHTGFAGYFLDLAENIVVFYIA